MTNENDFQEAQVRFLSVGPGMDHKPSRSSVGSVKGLVDAPETARRKLRGYGLAELSGPFGVESTWIIF